MIRRTLRRRMKRKQPTRKFFRKRSTSVGKLMPPVDIRSKSQLGELMRRITKGPVTVVLVYADWCGHCTEFKPHFNKASQSPNRTTQVVSVNEKMVQPMNELIIANNSKASPVSVSGYPSVILMDQAGTEISRVEPIKSTEAMTRVMEESGRIMKEGNTSLEPILSNSTVRNINLNNSKNANRNLSKNLTKNSIKNSIKNVNKSKTINNNITAPKKSELRGEDTVSSMPMVIGEPTNEIESMNATTVVSPPLEEAIIEANSKSQKGGSLFSALSASASHLAPAGILMGIASMTLKKKKHFKRRKTHRKY